MRVLRLTRNQLEEILNMKGRDLHILPKSNNLLHVIRHDLSKLIDGEGKKGNIPDEFYLEIYE